MNKEIEALSEIIGSCNTKCDHPFDCSHCKAIRAHKAGYRKASDVVREIFEEIDKLVHLYLNDADYSFGEFALDLAELRKKHESED